jgi:hypothetical protein
MPRPSKRLIFIDQTRALAITMMLIGHSLDRFLGEPWRSGELYRHYSFVRGLSSALFLTIAGFSFVVASMGHLDDYTQFSPRLYKRIRRIGLILLLGFVIQLPVSTLYGLVTLSTDTGWARLYAFNVLQNIGFGLLLMHVVLFMSKSVDLFRWSMTGVAIAIIVLAPLTYHPAVDSVLPMWLKGALNLYHRARFPIVPFAAFIALGAVFGAVFWRYQGARREHWVFVSAVVVSLLLLAFEQFIRHGIPGGLFPFSTQAPAMPGNTFARAGCAILIISAIYFISRLRIWLAELSRLMSQCSLAIYFAHLYLVYGGAQIPGLFSSYKHNMHPSGAFLWIVGLWSAMVGMAALLRYADTHFQERYRQLQHTTLATMFIQFLFFKRATLVSAAVIFAAVELVTVLWRRYQSVQPFGKSRPSAVRPVPGDGQALVQHLPADEHLGESLNR